MLNLKELLSDIEQEYRKIVERSGKITVEDTYSILSRAMRDVLLDHTNNKQIEPESDSQYSSKHTPKYDSRSKTEFGITDKQWSAISRIEENLKELDIKFTGSTKKEASAFISLYIYKKPSEVRSAQSNVSSNTVSEIEDPWSESDSNFNSQDNEYTDDIPF